MNDLRLTAYALGELTGREREEFERELAASENLQRALNETTQLTESLGQLPMPTETLPEKDRAALRNKCAANLKVARQRITPRRALTVLAAGALAASIGVAFLVLQTAPENKSDPTRIAQTETPTLPASSREANVRADQNPGVAAAPPAATPSPADLVALNGTIQDEAKNLGTANQVSMAQSGAMSDVRSAPSEIVNFKAALGKRGSARLASPELAKTKKVTSFTSGLTGGRGAGAGVQRTDASQSSLDSHPLPRTRRDFDTETYDAIQENGFRRTTDHPLSTFSIDVDTASYANVRRFLQSGQLPPPGAIRTEELINYFPYHYPQPQDRVPFSVNLEVSRAPWAADRQLVRIGLQGRTLPAAERGPANLVFLVDVSGSMNGPDKLPLLKRSLRALVEQLSAEDRVALVVYAGSSGLVLPSTAGRDSARILAALERLQAGGSTNGASGIQLAYDVARKNFLSEGSNRVILCTDGDFNVGTTDQSALVRLIEKERASGVFLSVLGFGTGNLKDSTMEKLADQGNGNYAYIDSFSEGRKVLVEQMGATLFTIAKDVKIQVEFNPARVAGYRLIGYENRLLAKEDFNDDSKDAGEIGAGHAVTALYEIIPAGHPLPGSPNVDPLKYQSPTTPKNPQSKIRHPQSKDLLTVKLRYKAPDGETSQRIEVPLEAPEITDFAEASPDFRFASAVAAFGMKLRGSPDAGEIGWSEIQSIVRGSLGEDPGSYRAEFLTLIEKVSHLAPPAPTEDE